MTLYRHIIHAIVAQTPSWKSRELEEGSEIEQSSKQNHHDDGQHIVVMNLRHSSEDKRVSLMLLKFLEFGDSG